MEQLWAFLGTLAQTVVGFIPGWILSLCYPTSKLKAKLAIFAAGVGPHLYVNPQRSPGVEHLRLLVFSGLPFDVELEEIQCTIVLGSGELAKCDKFVREIVKRIAVTPVTLSHDLTDGQARMIRAYPSGCPILGINGKAHFRASWRSFPVGFDVQTRAFRFSDDEAARLTVGQRLGSG